jgi:hypothetical protein
MDEATCTKCGRRYTDKAFGDLTLIGFIGDLKERFELRVCGDGCFGTVKRRADSPAGASSGRRVALSTTQGHSGDAGLSALTGAAPFSVKS